MKFDTLATDTSGFRPPMMVAKVEGGLLVRAHSAVYVRSASGERVERIGSGTYVDPIFVPGNSFLYNHATQGVEDGFASGKAFDHWTTYEVA